jgi:hypothetical protein
MKVADTLPETEGRTLSPFKILFLYFVKNAWKAKLDFWKVFWSSHNFTCDNDNVRNVDDDDCDHKYKETPVYMMHKKYRSQINGDGD